MLPAQNSLQWRLFVCVCVRLFFVLLKMSANSLMLISLAAAAAGLAVSYCISRVFFEGRVQQLLPSYITATFFDQPRKHIRSERLEKTG